MTLYRVILTAAPEKRAAALRAVRDAGRILTGQSSDDDLATAQDILALLHRDGEALVGATPEHERAQRARSALVEDGCKARLEQEEAEPDREPEPPDDGPEPSYAACRVALVLMANHNGNAAAALGTAVLLGSASEDEELYGDVIAALVETFPTRPLRISDILSEYGHA